MNEIQPIKSAQRKKSYTNKRSTQLDYLRNVGILILHYPPPRDIGFKACYFNVMMDKTKKWRRFYLGKKKKNSGKKGKREVFSFNIYP